MNPNYPSRSSEFYEEIGRALSAWQAVETHLTPLYANLVGSTKVAAAFASFRAVISLNTKLQMITEAAAITLEKSDFKAFGKLAQKIRLASKKRNKLAHYMYNAVVDDSGELEIYLAHIGSGPANPDSALVRLDDIRKWRSEWSELHLEVVEFVVSQFTGSKESSSDSS